MVRGVQSAMAAIRSGKAAPLLKRQWAWQSSSWPSNIRWYGVVEPHERRLVSVVAGPLEEARDARGGDQGPAGSPERPPILDHVALVGLEQDRRAGTFSVWNERENACVNQSDCSLSARRFSSEVRQRPVLGAAVVGPLVEDEEEDGVAPTGTWSRCLRHRDSQLRSPFRDIEGGWRRWRLAGDTGSGPGPSRT